MIVVSNTSTIMNLAAVGQLDLLERLYKKVYVPVAISEELSGMSEFIGTLRIQTVSWIETRAVINRSLVDMVLMELDKGEVEAIILAKEMKANLILLDERRGRKVASRLGFKFIGLLGILVEAKRRGLITMVKPVLDDLIYKAGFWIGSKLYDRVLQEVGESR